MTTKLTIHGPHLKYGKSWWLWFNSSQSHKFKTHIIIYEQLQDLAFLLTNEATNSRWTWTRRGGIVGNKKNSKLNFSWVRLWNTYFERFKRLFLKRYWNLKGKMTYNTRVFSWWRPATADGVKVSSFSGSLQTAGFLFLPQLSALLCFLAL